MEKIQACYSSIHPPRFLLWNLQGIKCHMWKLNIHCLAELQVNVWYKKLSRNRKTNVSRILWHFINYEFCYHYSCPEFPCRYSCCLSNLIFFSHKSFFGLLDHCAFLILTTGYCYQCFTPTLNEYSFKKDITYVIGLGTIIILMFYLPFKINHLVTP